MGKHDPDSYIYYGTKSNPNRYEFDMEEEVKKANLEYLQEDRVEQLELDYGNRNEEEAHLYFTCKEFSDVVEKYGIEKVLEVLLEVTHAT